MPIRAGRAALYGPDWKAFSVEIRIIRAGGRCECSGECGTRHLGGITRGRCGVMHQRQITRVDERGRQRQITVVLTVAHLCHDETCRKRRHVKAMCQQCHLRYDAHHHARNASLTRDAKRGQTRMVL